MSEESAKSYTEKELMDAMRIPVRWAFHRMILDDTMNFTYKNGQYHVLNNDLVDFLYRCEMGLWNDRRPKKVRTVEELQEMGFGPTLEKLPTFSPEESKELRRKAAAWWREQLRLEAERNAPAIERT